MHASDWMVEERSAAEDLIRLENMYGAQNYRPLDVVIERGEGAWVYDVDGKRYLDCLAAYSAVNQGHCHPKIVGALVAQAQKLTLTSRAFRNEQLPLFYKELHDLTGFEMALPMNTGAEAVETAIKMARKWGYTVKGIPLHRAEIIVCENNFHGRTVTVISFSSEEQYRRGFGPFTPGFHTIPFGDAAALEHAINDNTCAFLVEPIQGEAGIVVPPEGYLAEAAEICRRNNVLLMTDEIQSGLGRTGKLFAYMHDDITPDVLIVGKALAGGCYPVSAVLASREIMGVFKPGDHGSTFGGNPLACAVARAALRVIVEEKLVERSAQLGAHLRELLAGIKSPNIRAVRGKGLWIGIELNGPARPYCEALMREGVLCKETHDRVLRIAPPLVIGLEDVDWAYERIRKVLVKS
jgi:ornithine--oxo-acid transaminase